MEKMNPTPTLPTSGEGKIENQMVEQGVCQRTLTVNLRWQKDANGNLWFVAKDVAEMLGLEWKGSESIRYLDEDERDTLKVESSGGVQEMIGISESGMYALIMRSNKEEARRFRRWVTGEVLPSIRKTGKYETIKEVIDNMEREEEEIRRTVLASMMHGDQKKMGEELGIDRKRLGYWLRGKWLKSGRRSLEREEVMEVLAWVREKNMRIVNEHIKAQVEMKF